MQCLADTEKAREIAAASQTQSDELGVTGTPTFFLNGTRVASTSWGPAQSDPGLEAALRAAGAR